MKNTQYFQRLWNSFKVILKEPLNVGKQFLDSGDFILGLGFIVAGVLSSGIFFFLFGFRLNLGVMKIFNVMSKISAKHISLLSYFGMGLYIYALSAVLLFAVMYLFSKLFQNPGIDTPTEVILVSMQAIFDIPVILVAACISLLSSVVGLFVYVVGKLLGLIIVSKLYPYEGENGSEKASYIVFSIYGATILIKAVLDLLMVSMMLK